MTAATATLAPAPLLFGFPRGAALIVAIEFFERFSFYSMLSLLVLFLTAPAGEGGFGWQEADALALLGVYTGLMYALPFFGGLAADQFWTYRRGIAIGAALMVVGHFAMATPALGPWLIDLVTGTNSLETLHDTQGELGRFGAPSDVASAGAGFSYAIVTFGFHAALALLVLGNALMKSPLSITLGQCFRDGDPKRDGAYAYFYLSISVGALIAGVAAGWAAQRFGWHVGFSMAGFGMLIAWALYLALGTKWLGDAGLRRPAASADHPTASPSAMGGRIVILAILALLMCVYMIGSFQLWGTWMLFVENSVDRTVGGFEIPPPWFSSFNSAVVLPATPAFAALFLWFDQRGRSLDIFQKYAFALACSAISLAMFGVVGLEAQAGALVLPFVPLIAITIMSVGEVAAWISTYGAVFRTAPQRWVGAAMGGFYAVTLGAGGFLAGWLGQFAPTMAFSTFSFLLAGGTAVTLATILLARPALKRLAAQSGARLSEVENP